MPTIRYWNPQSLNPLTALKEWVAVGKYIYIYTILMQNNLKYVWKTIRKRSAVVLHLLPSTYKLVLCLTKIVQHQLVLKKRMLPLLWKYCGILPSHALQEVIFWVTIHQKELTSSLRKEHTLWDNCPDLRASLPPQALSSDLRFTDWWRSPSMLVPMLPSYSAEQ